MTAGAQLDTASKPAAKRAIVQAFGNSIFVMQPHPLPVIVKMDPVPYRVDVRLSDNLVSQIISASAASPLESRSTDLAIFILSKFNGSSSMFTFRTGTLAKAHHKIESDTAL
jgi:hypothetical protein